MLKVMLPQLPESLRSPLIPSVPQKWEPAEPVEQLVLPELYCPFISVLNQHAEVVDTRTIAWVRHHHLLVREADYQHFSVVRLGWLAARTNPTASLNSLQMVTDWCSWFFIRDDYCDEWGIGTRPEALRRLHARFLAILGGTPLDPEDSALAGALHELWQRTLPETTESWRRRFVANLQTFFAAGVWEATNRAEEIIPDVTTYLKMRPFTGGLYAYIDLFELSEEICLPNDVLQDFTVQQLTTKANNAVCWANDIMSLAKEIKQGDIHNVILSMRQKQTLTLQQAVDRAAALHDAEVRAFIELELRLPSFGFEVDEQLHRYTSTLRGFMRGSLDWLYTSARYLVGQAEEDTVQ
ncbi:MAG: hypothetical protein H0X37_07820 [Herpetosiphonaceae bacterium]|nr:hypothetical protein [Herpetosiphonaceae bacterium]